MSTSNNLQLARDLIRHLSEVDMCFLAPSDREIMNLLEEGGEEDDLVYLPGETLGAIKDNLKKVIELASEPAPMPATGRGRETRQRQAANQRGQMILFCRVAMALIEPEHTAHASREADAMAVLRSIQVTAATFLSGVR